MTPEAFKDALEQLGLSPVSFSNIILENERTVPAGRLANFPFLALSSYSWCSASFCWIEGVTDNAPNSKSVQLLIIAPNRVSQWLGDARGVKGYSGGDDPTYKGAL